MKCALLVADFVNPEFLPIAGDLSGIFQRFFACYPHVSLHSYPVWQNQFPLVKDYDTFIITGSRFSIFADLPWVNNLKILVNEALSERRKVLGFCFGHQLLAHVLGGDVKAFPQNCGNYGLLDLCVAHTTEWMRPMLNNYKLLFNHKYFVCQLPDDVKVLAATPDYIQMFVYQDLAFGLQAHPEYSIEYQRAIMGDNESLTPYQSPGLTDTKLLVESVATIRQWLYRFLQTSEIIRPKFLSS